MKKILSIVVLVAVSFLFTNVSLSASDPTAGWKIFTDKTAGITFKYPKTITLGQEPDLEKSVLTVNVYAIAELDHPLYDAGVIAADKIALSAGQFGQGRPGEPFEASKKVLALSKTVNAQDQITFSEYEICDIQFNHQLVFFNKEKVIVISLYGPTNALIKATPQYFTKCLENSKTKMWTDKQADFYQKIITNKAPTKVMDWYKMFYSIAKTIKIS